MNTHYCFLHTGPLQLPGRLRLLTRLLLLASLWVFASSVRAHPLTSETRAIPKMGKGLPSRATVAVSRGIGKHRALGTRTPQNQATTDPCVFVPKDITLTGMGDPLDNVYKPSGTYNNAPRWSYANFNISWNGRWELSDGDLVFAYVTSGSINNLPCSGWQDNGGYGVPTLSGGCGSLVAAPPSVSVTLSSQTITSGGSVTLTASGATTSYRWSNGSTDNPLVLTNVTSATTLSVTGTSGTCSGTASAAVSVTAAADPCVFVPQNITVSNTNNYNGTYIPDGTYNNVPRWSNNGTFIRWTGTNWELFTTGGNGFLSQVAGTATNLPCTGWLRGPGGSAMLSGGCGSLVAGPPSISITATPSLTITSGGSVTLTASGATSYTWSNGVQSTSVVLSNVTSATTLSVTGTTSGCSGTASAAVSVTFLTFCNTVAYVTPTGNGTKNGSSWANALPGDQFPQALATACSGTTFLVGGGLYKPTTGIDQTASFSIASGVEVYGGYTVSGSTGIRPAIDPVNGTPSSTTFSGEIGNEETVDNSFHVVQLVNTTGNTRLDGIVVTAGNAEIDGGGIYSEGGRFTLANVSVVANRAFNNGGGLCSTNSTIGIIGSVFTDNKGYSGGGIYAQNASLTLTGVTVSQNTATSNNGGGIYVTTSSSLVMTNTDVLNNQAGFQGGGIYGDKKSILNATGGRVVGNQSYFYGGGIFFEKQATLTGVQISQNTVTGSGVAGGGFASTSSLTATFESCTIAQNANADGGTGVSSSGSNSRFVFNNTLFAGNDGTTSESLNGGGAFGSTTGSGLLAQFSSCTFTGNKNYCGGAIGMPESATLQVSNSVFTGNQANSLDQSNGGGAINTRSVSMTVTGSHFSQNSAAVGENSEAQGGAILVNASGSGVSISGCSFSANVAPNGGAYYNRSARFSLATSLFVNNQSTAAATDEYGAEGGGAIFVNGTNSEVASIQSCTFTQNRSAAHGGALCNRSGTGELITNSVFDKNQAAATGGGLFTNSVSLTITNSQFTSNTATGNGGGGAYIGAPYSFSNVQWKNNSIAANGTGGALFINNYNSGKIINNLFEQNGSTSTGPGGAIHAFGGNHLLVNTNLNRNAAQTGGAISAGANLTLLNCTLNGNTATSGGTVFVNSNYGTVRVQNSIIWGNGSAPDNFSVVADEGGGLTLQNSIIDPTSTTYADGGNNKTQDPLFTNEAGNDLTLTGCSPAVNAGDNALYTAAGGPATDLGGLTRLTNTTVDMGAYEFQGTPGSLTLTITAAPSRTVALGGSVTLTASGASSYTWSNGVVSTSVVLTNPTSATTLSVTGVTGACSGTASAAVSVTTAAPITSTVGVGTLSPTNCLVSTTLLVSGNRFTVTGPGNYTVTRSFRTLQTNYALIVTSMTTPGTYTVTAYNALGQTTLSYFQVGGTACGSPILQAKISHDERIARKASTGLSLTMVPSSLTYGTGQLVTVRVTGGQSGTAYSVDLYDSPSSYTGNLTNFLSYSTSQGTGNTVQWGANGVEEFYVIFQPGSEGIDRIVEVSDPTFIDFVDSSPFAIQDCTPVSVSITATPSLTVLGGSSVTLTASGATSYTWSNGVQSTSVVLTNLSSSTALSVTGVTGVCSATARAAVVVIPCNLTAVITPNPGLTICANAGGVLTATGAGDGGRYVWSTNATTAAITVSSSGPYTVTALNSVGCSSTATVTVTAVNPAPLAQPVLSASSSAVCEGGSVSVTATVTGSVDTYQWYKDGLSLGSAQSSSVLTLNGVSSAQVGSYVLVIGSSGCGSATSTAFTVRVNPLPVVTITFPQSAVVNPAGPVVTGPVGMGLSYQVFGGGSNGRYERKIVLDRLNGFEIRTTMENTTGIFPLDKAGPYTIRVTDGNGCSRTVTGEIRGQ